MSSLAREREPEHMEQWMTDTALSHKPHCAPDCEIMLWRTREPQKWEEAKEPNNSTFIYSMPSVGKHTKTLNAWDLLVLQGLIIQLGWADLLVSIHNLVQCLCAQQWPEKCLRQPASRGRGQNRSQLSSNLRCELPDPWGWDRHQVSMWRSCGSRALLLKGEGVLKKRAAMNLGTRHQKWRCDLLSSLYST